jgi:non-canonical (house-cleaning) NTP pyrophosphatase
MEIILGSTSVHKLNAVHQACKELGLTATVSGVKTLSGQNEQPVGFNEIFNGALARAISAQSQKLGNFFIGIESGIISFGITLDIAIIVILTCDGRQIISTSHGLQFPEKYVEIAKERGYKKTTVGSIITEQLGGDPTDPHSILTNGKVTRTMTLVDALVIALRQL